jgi:hypothetical protein
MCARGESDITSRLQAIVYHQVVTDIMTLSRLSTDSPPFSFPCLSHLCWPWHRRQSLKSLIIPTGSPLVTFRTAVVTLKNATFCPHSAFTCFVWISEQIAIISLHNINWLVFIPKTESVYCAVRTGSLIQVTFCLQSVKVLNRMNESAVFTFAVPRPSLWE